jgi:hypothetical protein
MTEVSTDAGKVQIVAEMHSEVRGPLHGELAGSAPYDSLAHPFHDCLHVRAIGLAIPAIYNGWNHHVALQCQVSFKLVRALCEGN